MLSAFPSLLSWSQVSPLILRVALGIILLYWTYKTFKQSGSMNTKIVSAFEGVAGILLILGLWTQIAALFVIIEMLVHLGNKIRSRAFLTDGVNYYLLILVIAVSLIVTGPGLLAFDLPL